MVARVFGQRLDSKAGQQLNRLGQVSRCGLAHFAGSCCGVGNFSQLEGPVVHCTVHLPAAGRCIPLRKSAHKVELAMNAGELPVIRQQVFNERFMGGNGRRSQRAEQEQVERRGHHTGEDCGPAAILHTRQVGLRTFAVGIILDRQADPQHQVVAGLVSLEERHDEPQVLIHICIDGNVHVCLKFFQIVLAITRSAFRLCDPQRRLPER